MNILIVEDEIVQVTALKLQLSQIGFEKIVIARDGFEAYESFEEQHFDFIFCDINMPNMDGISFLSSLYEKDPTVGVAILSSVEDQILLLARDMCELAGFPFVRAIRKPISKIQLQSVMTEFTRTLEFDNEQFLSKKETEISEEKIIVAFNEGHFIPYFQPQFNLETNQVVGVEALVRYIEPDKGIVPPNLFLPKIKSMNRSNDLFKVMLESSIEMISSLDKNLLLSVNFDQTNLQINVCDLAISTCKKFGFSPSMLTLEMTEDEVYQCTIHGLENLARLRLNDIGLAIDDFGTGHASLQLLSQLPFTELKIDQQFSRNLGSDYKNQQLTKTCQMLSNSLGLECVIEGIEDDESLKYSKFLGIDKCQGFYLGKPMPIESLYNIFSSNERYKVNVEDH